MSDSPTVFLPVTDRTLTGTRTTSLDGPSIAAGAYVGLGCSLVGTITGVSGTSLFAGCGHVRRTVALAVGSRPDRVLRWGGDESRPASER